MPDRTFEYRWNNEYDVSVLCNDRTVAGIEASDPDSVLVSYKLGHPSETRRRFFPSLEAAQQWIENDLMDKLEIEGDLRIQREWQRRMDATPMFNPEATCVKCGEMRVNTQYDDRMGVLVRTCSRCRYLWYEKPLDYKEEAPSQSH